MMNVSPLAPTNSLVSPMLTDLYQLTMVYAYWKVGRHNDHAVFDLFFRKNPFKGEYTVFAGLEEALALINTFKFTESDIAYLRVVLPNAEDAFFQWLATLDCSQIKVYAIKEGTIVFPRIPLLRIEGNLAVGQLLETPLLNLLNFASLITTNATRFKRAAGPDKSLLEFGLRRAQGPDGGLSASRYSYMAGFAGTSNVLAGKLHNIPIKGTHAHAFVQAHTDLDDVKVTTLDGKNFLEIVLKYRRELECTRTNDGELAAFISYAIAFPSSFLALVDTYETLTSGVPNFLCVALALHELGYKPVGIRLDSGDLSYLSKQARVAFKATGERFGIDYFSKLNITASNDINEAVLNSLNEQVRGGHEIDSYGIGTHLVTCQAQPALGGNHDDAPFEWPLEWFSAPGIPHTHCNLPNSSVSGEEECFRGTPRIELMKNEIQRNTLSYSRNGPIDLWPSISNYVLKVSSSQDPDSAVALLYFLDSGGGSYPEVISSAQAEWFNRKSQELNPNSSVPEIIFWHIPSKAYKEVAPMFRIHKPCVGSINKEKVASQEAEMGIMKLLVERPSVKAVFVGHNHGLDWCCPYEKLWLCFARHTGYGGYGNWRRGARILEITEQPFSLKSWIRMENGHSRSEVLLSS